MRGPTSPQPCGGWDDAETHLFAPFDDDTVVWPGHGVHTTLGAERPHLAEWRERGWRDLPSGAARFASLPGVSEPHPTPASSPAGMNTPEMRRILFSSFMGSAIEMYDFLLYALATSLVFDKVFFNNLSPGLATVAGFATFAITATAVLLTREGRGREFSEIDSDARARLS